MRLGIATGQGHAAMVYRRFGKWRGRFSVSGLLLVNFLTLVTDFAVGRFLLGATGNAIAFLDGWPGLHGLVSGGSAEQGRAPA